MKVLLSPILPILGLTYPATVLAQSASPAPPVGQVTPPVCLKSTFGCIPTNPVALVGLLLQIGIGVAGGIAFLMMVYGSIKLITSAGDPNSIQTGKEYLTYAILGMLVIVFSVFILSLLGVKILQIPGLG